MRGKLETNLGFNASPAVERIESGIAVVMAGAVVAAIAAVDQLSGVVPDIVRWVVTALLLSLPFAFISLGLVLPDALVSTANQASQWVDGGAVASSSQQNKGVGTNKTD